MDQSHLLSESTRRALGQLVLQRPTEQRSIIEDLSSEIVGEALRNDGSGISSAAFLESVESIIQSRTQYFSTRDKNFFRRALIAGIAVRTPDIVVRMGLPEPILRLYPETFDRLLQFLKRSGNGTYDLTSDFFRKDISFVLALLVPCGGTVSEVNSYFMPRSIIRALFRSGNFRSIIQFARADGFGPWARLHLESRYLDEFNESGYDAMYFRIAALLEKFPRLRGMAATSWLYDPQLLAISPHLGFLQRPLERGAFTIRHGTAPEDIVRATSTSKTRRHLYELGKYIPISVTLLWPRTALISWAEKMEGQKGELFGCI